MSDDDQRKARLQALNAMTDIEPLLDMLDGMTAAVRRRGFTDDQARAIVAYIFGYRPTTTNPDTP